MVAAVVVAVVVVAFLDARLFISLGSALTTRGGMAEMAVTRTDRATSPQSMPSVLKDWTKARWTKAARSETRV